MLSSLLAAITCLTFPVSDPLEFSAVMPPDTAPVAVGTYVTPTSFRSRNFSDTTHLLVFAAQGVPDPILVTLPVGGVVEFQFSPEALAGVSLEVVEVRDDVFTTTGIHPLLLPAGSLDMSLWNVPASPGFVTWQQIGCEVSELTPSGSHLPPGSISNDPDTQSSVVAPPVTVPRVIIDPAPDEDYTPM